MKFISLTMVGFAIFLINGLNAFAHSGPVTNSYDKKPILADLNFLNAAGIPVIQSDAGNNLGVGYMTPDQERKVSELAHQNGKCGGFESLEGADLSADGLKNIFRGLETIKVKNLNYQAISFRDLRISPKSEVVQAMKEVSSENLLNWVQWLSAYHSRYNRLSEPNKHVEALVERIKSMMASSSLKAKIETIDHQSTRQKSIRVTIPGSKTPNEIIVLGGHLDSINGGGSDLPAPGADDNASGSANLLEALRVVLNQAQPERTVEFYWYAGEESGLLGSQEIARQAKDSNREIIGVLQLDMTLFPGDGAMTIANIGDYTNSWLRDYLSAVNTAYLNINLVEGTCGYGCSDHASWHRQGFPAVFPFESTLRNDNKNIHTAKDIISNKLNFEHSLVFSKIALAFAMDLANSDLHHP